MAAAADRFAHAYRALCFVRFIFYRVSHIVPRMTKSSSNIQINPTRLWDTILETAKFGATAKGGIRRLTLGPEDKQVRDWFRKDRKSVV